MVPYQSVAGLTLLPVLSFHGPLPADLMMRLGRVIVPSCTGENTSAQSPSKESNPSSCGLTRAGAAGSPSACAVQALTPLRMAFVHRVAPLTPSTPSALPFATMLWQYCSIGEARRVK